MLPAPELKVKFWPPAMVRPALAVIKPEKVGVLVIVMLLHVPFAPKVTELPPPLRLPVPLAQVKVALPCTAVLAALPYATAKLVEPPSETAPPPDKPLPAVTVRELLVRAALAIEAAVMLPPLRLVKPEPLPVKALLALLSVKAWL